MKYLRYIYISAALLSAGLCLSCTKYLDIKPYGKTIPQSAEEFSALLHHHLDKIDHGEETIVGNISSVCDLECYADNLEANLTSYPDGNYIPVYVGADLSKKQSLYSNLYEVIRDCNITIGYLEERDTRLGKDILGTAYALRGICWYNLLRDFCEPCCRKPDIPGVPIVTEFDMEAKPLRSTAGQTAAQAESDFLKAISYDISDPVLRFNSDVMKGYLARLYFWIGDYANAAKYAREVLQTYPLLSGNAYTQMLASETAKTGNILLKSCLLLDSSDRLSYNGAKKYTASRPVSKRFVDLFAEKDQDVRYSLSFNSKRAFTKNVFACLRSAEMQCILAESLYHTGDSEGALAALNELRRNRITGVADYTKANLPQVDHDDLVKSDALGNELTPLLYAILCERRKELFMEGDRWYELKRNGRPEFWTAKQGSKYTTMKFMYTFPLPINDIELVKGLVQNEGYEKTK